MANDPRIDAYIAKAAPFAQPILLHLRHLVHATVAGLEETLKWGMPHFVYKGKNLAGLAAFKAHAAFIIHGDGRQGDAMGQYGKITALADLPADADLAVKLLAVTARIDATGSGAVKKAVMPKTKPEIPMPDDFAETLDRLPKALVIWAAFAPSHRREYLEWIVEAKRPETRAKRIVQAGEWIASGKKRNWKYEAC